jgi:hypothetical protein
LLQAKQLLHRSLWPKVTSTKSATITRIPRSKSFKKRSKKRQNGAKTAGRGWGYSGDTPLDIDDEEELHDTSAGPAAEEDEDEDKHHDSSSEDEDATGFYNVVTEEPRCGAIAVAFISPTHKRTEGRASEWGFEFTTKTCAICVQPFPHLFRGHRP